MKNRISLILGSIVMLFITSCHDVLDKENLSAINPDDILTNPDVAEAYVNDIHASFNPSFGIWESSGCDEAMGAVSGTSIDGKLQGIITEDAVNHYPYDGIRNMNIFLKDVDEATYDEATKKRLKGEVLFWRAWAYFSMVKLIGGVPLILEPGSAEDIESNFVPRNSTTECFAQIHKDLDDAISLLEDPLGNGRIDKGAAMAFKGRVALYQASPQFNRSGTASFWQAAYDANKAALTYLNGQGKGLYPDYGQIWLVEMNEEVIMGKRFKKPSATNGWSQVCLMPLKYAKTGCAGANFPTLELVDAFPMKDGSKWDPNAMDYIGYHENRDDRFYSTIAYNGSEPYLLEMFENEENLWSYWYDKDGDPSTGINGKEMRQDFAGNLESYASFYPKKMLDPKIDGGTRFDGDVDWIEIRYAEVLMNTAEAANEIGKDSEALDALKLIRDRAGIEMGDGSYGITATTKDEIRQAIKDERFVEFAFEAKRYSDLRRWRDYKSTMEGLVDSRRHGLRIEWLGTAEDRPQGLEDLNSIINQFSVSVIDDVMDITMLEEDKYSFYGIHRSIIEANSKIEQNNTWGGTFDPLK